MEEIIRCSFCNKSNREVKKLIAAEDATICNECIDICNEVLKNEMVTKCNCGIKEKIIKDPEVPIEIETTTNQYYIVCKDDKKLSVYHCLFCGGALNDIERAKSGSFQSIDHGEVVELQNAIKLAKTIEEIISILGQPDDIVFPEPFLPKDKEIYNLKDIKQSLRFSNVAKSFSLIIQEFDDGSLDRTFFPKLKS